MVGDPGPMLIDYFAQLMSSRLLLRLFFIYHLFLRLFFVSHLLLGLFFIREMSINRVKLLNAAPQQVHFTTQNRCRLGALLKLNPSCGTLASVTLNNSSIEVKHSRYA